MKDTFAVLNHMASAGAIENYALAGAVGAMFYVEPFSTQDIDVLVMTPGEGMVIEGWPVQFLPVTNALEREAYLNAEITNLEGVPVRVVLAEHLVAIMLNVGRLKDLARIQMFCLQDAVKIDLAEDIIQRHGLSEKWTDFKLKFLQ